MSEPRKVYYRFVGTARECAPAFTGPWTAAPIWPALKPCPFCGEPQEPDCPEDSYVCNQGTKWGHVECACGACGPEVRTGYEPSVAWASYAAEEWNGRCDE